MSETTTGRADTSEASVRMAAGLAAIKVCARAGSEREAVRILLDLEVPLSEAPALHGPICLINRKAAETNAPGD